MMNWLRRADPAFYQKEPHVLRAEAQIPRYSDEAQVAARLDVLRADHLLYVAVAIIVASCYALIAIPVTWTRFDTIALGVAAVVVIALRLTHARVRSTLLVAAIGTLFGVHAHPLSIAPLAGILAAAASVIGANVVSLQWRARPQFLTWSAFTILLVVCAYTLLFNAPALERHLRVEITAIALAYLCVCVVAGRIRRAEFLARPEGVLSIPQSIVPLLDRSHDHAVICWTV
jgi:hypothetical protein